MTQRLTYCIDLDGTLCSNTFGEYEKAAPIQYAIDQVNFLHSVGHKIKIFTARGSKSGIDWRITTENQLQSWSSDEVSTIKAFSPLTTRRVR